MSLYGDLPPPKKLEGQEPSDKEENSNNITTASTTIDGLIPKFVPVAIKRKPLPTKLAPIRRTFPKPIPIAETEPLSQPIPEPELIPEQENLVSDPVIITQYDPSVPNLYSDMVKIRDQILLDEIVLDENLIPNSSENSPIRRNNYSDSNSSEDNERYDMIGRGRTVFMESKPKFKGFRPPPELVNIEPSKSRSRSPEVSTKFRSRSPEIQNKSRSSSPERTELTQQLSPCLILTNLLLRGTIDQYFESELLHELSQYGNVESLHIYEAPHPWPNDKAVRIHIKFQNSNQATNALNSLNDRLFAGRKIRVDRFDEQRFNNKQFEPRLDDPDIMV